MAGRGQCAFARAPNDSCVTSCIRCFPRRAPRCERVPPTSGEVRVRLSRLRCRLPDGLRFGGSAVRPLKCALHFALPGQGMNNFIQMHSGRLGRQRSAIRIQQCEVGDHAEGVGNRQHALPQLHPIPGHAGRVARRRITPHRLAAAWADSIAKIQHTGSQVNQVQLGRCAGLPQYGRPGTDDPCRGHDIGRVDDGSFQGDRMNRSVARLGGLAICKTCQGGSKKRTGGRW